MTLVKWHPTNSVANWNSFDNLFRDFFKYADNDNSEITNWVPSTDIEENDKSYTVTADLPGVDKKNIKINVVDNVLTLSGERHLEKTGEKDSYYRRERSSGIFKRCFRLPEEVMEDKIGAKFKNGILTIEIPKAEIVKPKEIEIKVA